MAVVVVVATGLVVMVVLQQANGGDGVRDFLGNNDVARFYHCFSNV
jgi:preprotein translocase subunit SecG